MTAQLRGIALRILSGLLFTAMAATIKAIGDAVPLGQLVFFRSAVAMVPLVIFLWARQEFPQGLATRRPMGHLVRCILGGAAMFTSFATLRLLPIAEATMLSYLSPVMTVALAALLLNERSGLYRWLGVGFGLFGAAVLTFPHFTADSPQLLGIALGLTTAGLTAGALVQVRTLAKSESPGAIAFYFALASAAFGLATAPCGWSAPEPLIWLLLILTGLFGGAAHIAMTLAFRYAEASLLAPFEYLTVLWAAAIGAVAFAEIPGLTFLLAAPLVVMGALLSTSGVSIRRAHRIQGSKGITSK
ncbi:DMT family transporter [Thalassococcus sp. S3]|uniref:DMT family transporter n=1 Tax=Thalassococcus sp. S3 TaxID=2017482 RepID=UPI0010245305|nr:DMT family transporter [Thalassococcus sp. S3]QBF32692.1 EamA family transporter [Thalassococcus sp. S3]